MRQSTNSMFRIVPWLAVGGMERMQVTLANALAARGYDVTVMALAGITNLLLLTLTVGLVV